MDVSVFNPITESDHLGWDWLDWNNGHKVYHPGCDLNGKGAGNSDLGNKIFLPADGKCVFASEAPSWRNGQNGGFGWHMVFYHREHDLWTHYAHCDILHVKQWDILKAGVVIGEIGSTGTSSAHLHFEVWTRELAAIQNNHWRKYSYYPKNKSKTWVQKYYYDPYKFMELINKKEYNGVSDWAKEAWEWAVDKGLINDNDPQGLVTREQLAVILYRNK